MKIITQVNHTPKKLYQMLSENFHLNQIIQKYDSYQLANENKEASF